MNTFDPATPNLQPTVDEDATKIMSRADFAQANLNPDQNGQTTRIQRAHRRTEQAEKRTLNANTRTEEAEVRTEQANTRTEQAEARTELANERTVQAEMRTKEAEARVVEATENGGMATLKKRILAVDDQASNTRLVKLCLEGTHQYLVREENDPKAALAAGEEFQPDLILLDVMMPGLDGGDLAACFQASPTLKAVPIVFLTAAVTKAEVEAGRGNIGGQAFLAKPIVLTEMVACLKQHLGG
jgi:CheY-like chemotaxis protein